MGALTQEIVDVLRASRIPWPEHNAIIQNLRWLWQTVQDSANVLEQRAREAIAGRDLSVIESVMADVEENLGDIAIRAEQIRAVSVSSLMPTLMNNLDGVIAGLTDTCCALQRLHDELQQPRFENKGMEGLHAEH